MTNSRSRTRPRTTARNLHPVRRKEHDELQRPEQTCLHDERSARILVAAAFPPLKGDAAALFVPTSDGHPANGVLCVVDDLPERPAQADVETCVGVFAEAVEGSAPGEPGLLVAFQRRGESGLRESDTVWVPAARKVCANRGVKLLGVWLVVGRDEPLRLDAA